MLKAAASVSACSSAARNDSAALMHGDIITLPTCSTQYYSLHFTNTLALAIHTVAIAYFSVKEKKRPFTHRGTLAFWFGFGGPSNLVYIFINASCCCRSRVINN